MCSPIIMRSAICAMNSDSVDRWMNESVGIKMGCYMSYNMYHLKSVTMNKFKGILWEIV